MLANTAVSATYHGRPREYSLSDNDLINTQPDAIQLRNHLVALHRRRKAAYVFDIDQTYADPIPGIHEGFPPFHDHDNLLVELYNQTNKGTALVTGRPLHFIKNAFPIFARNMIAATEFGGHIVQTENGNMTVLQQYADPDIEQVKEGLRALFRMHADGPLRNCEIESHKTVSITVACTKAPCQQAALGVLKEFFQAAVETSNSKPSGQRLVMGFNASYDNCTADIMPEIANKGIAKRFIIANNPAFKGRTTAVFGDSASDVPMMRVALENNGVAVWVGDKLPPSDFVPSYRLKNSDTVVAIMTQVARCRF